MHQSQSLVLKVCRRSTGILAALTACVLAGGDCSGQAISARQTPYDFGKPDTVFSLPGSLEEISGLTSVGDTLLGAIEDENGRLYLIDPSTGKLTERRKFAPDADYEGVEMVGRRLFLLRSNGTLYEIDDWLSDDPKVTKIETFLKSKNDTEGLAYDEEQDRLLVACKEDAGDDLGPDKRSIYEYVLTDSTMTVDPVIVIDAASVRSMFTGGEESAEVWLRRASRTFGFKPSAVALKPGTRSVYALSSVWKGIVVVETSGKVTNVIELPDRLFRQPEGIAFIGSDLWIADEGAGGDGRIFRYSPAAPKP